MQNTAGGWEDVYDKGISTLVREVLTVIEGTISDQSQRQALRQIIRRTIYGVTDNMKNDLVDSGLEKKKESYRYPR
jgi:secreted trypsin-like serine protease